MSSQGPPSAISCSPYDLSQRGVRAITHGCDHQSPSALWGWTGTRKLSDCLLGVNSGTRLSALVAADTLGKLHLPHHTLRCIKRTHLKTRRSAFWSGNRRGNDRLRPTLTPNWIAEYMKRLIKKRDYCKAPHIMEGAMSVLCMQRPNFAQTLWNMKWRLKLLITEEICSVAQLKWRKFVSIYAFELFSRRWSSHSADCLLNEAASYRIYCLTALSLCLTSGYDIARTHAHETD